MVGLAPLRFALGGRRLAAGGWRPAVGGLRLTAARSGLALALCHLRLTAKRPGLAPAGESLLSAGPERSNQERGPERPSVHPHAECIRHSCGSTPWHS